jgi:hypothetical protein
MTPDASDDDRTVIRPPGATPPTGFQPTQWSAGQAAGAAPPPEATQMVAPPPKKRRTMTKTSNRPSLCTNAVYRYKPIIIVYSIGVVARLTCLI